MAYMRSLLIMCTIIVKSHSEDNPPKNVYEGKVNSACKFETLEPSEYFLLHELKIETEARIICTGSKELQAFIKTVEVSKEKPHFIELNISNSTADRVLYGDLKHFPNLKYLIITGSNIATIEKETFKAQTFLNTLDLSGNQITALQIYAFEPLVNLRNLSLSDNKINTMDPNIFYNMSELLYLDLSENGFKTVDRNWFTSLKKLQTLLLKNNNIHSLETNSFQHLGNLQKLDLSFNHLKAISHPTFFYLKKLKLLSLAMNKFETLNKSTFRGNINLEKVNLTGNSWICDKKLLLLNDWLKRYESDKEGAFCMDPPELQNYTIQHGLNILNLEIKIQESPTCNKTMCSCTIAKDKLVISVDCSGRGFTSLPETVPYKTKVLNLCNNNIKSLSTAHIDADMWADVSFLHLNNNLIDSLHGLEGTFLLRNLVTLHLSNNQLTEIPIYILEQFREQLLDELYLSGNLWKCDCHSVRFQTWLQDNYKTVQDLDGIRCSSNNGVNSNQPIYQLLRSQLCPQHVQLVECIDVANGVMALAIVLIMMKLFYDYWLPEIEWWKSKHKGLSTPESQWILYEKEC